MSNASVNTVYAGESGPNDGDGIRTGLLITTLLVALALPIASLFAFFTWISFSWLRIRRSVIFAFLGVIVAILLLLTPFVNPLYLFISAWTVDVPELIKNISEGNNVIGTILLIFAKQAPISIAIGTLAGLLYASWFWKFRRAAWEEVNFRLTPWEWWRKRKNINDIKEDKNSPVNGLTIGISEKTGEKIIQTDDEGSAHTFYVGASGTGKTTSLMMTSRDIIKRGHGHVFVDPKNDPKVAETLKEYADRYGRTFRHWTMQSIREKYDGPSEMGPAYYDPIARGEASRRKNLLMAIKKWSEPYYESLAEEYLQKAFLILIGNPNKNVSTLEDISALLDPKVLLARSEKLAHDPNYRTIVEEIGRMGDDKKTREELSAIGSLRVDMKNLTHNVIGPWLKKDPNKLNDINLKDVANNGEVILFSLDSGNYEKETSVLGNLIVQDLKTVSSELLQEPSKYPMHITIDEFAAIGSDNIIQLINKSRASKMPVVLATQALGDLRKVDDSFLDQLLGIINAFCIHRPNTEEDSEILAGLTGRVTRKKFRQSVEHTKNFFGLGRGAGAGAGFIEDVEEYKITVPELQELQQGKMIYLSKGPARLEKVTVIPERADLTTPDRKMPLVHLARNANAIKVEPFNEYEKKISSNISESEDNLLSSITDDEPRIELRHSDPKRLEKIFNKPAKEFINDELIPEYSKHNLPPKQVQPEIVNKNETQPNLNPPVFTLPARKTIKTVNEKDEKVVQDEKKTVENPTQIVFPKKDKFDF